MILLRKMKKTPKFEAFDNEDALNKAYIDEKLKKRWTYFIYRKRM